MKDIDEGKKGSPSFSVAYNIRKRMAKKMSQGGMTQSREHVNRMHEDEPMYAHGGTVSDSSDENMMELRRKQIANAFGKKYAKGGMVDPEDKPSAMLGNVADSIMKKRMAQGGIVEKSDDFLSDEDDFSSDQFTESHDFEEPNKRKSMLDSIMRRR